MKRILCLISVMLVFAIGANSQTQSNPFQVTIEGVKNYNYSDTLKKDAVLTQYYWVKNYTKTIRLQVDIDTLAAGYLKVTSAIYGSLDNSNWVQLTGNVTGQLYTRSASTGAIDMVFNADSTMVGTYVPVNYTTTSVGTSTITTAGATSATSSTLFENVYYNYIKVVNTAIDSTQYALFRYKILFDKN